MNDVLAEKAAGSFDAVFLGIGAQVANHLDIPAMDGGKIIDAVTLMERVEKGRAPSLGRVVGIVGGGNTAMDAARIAKRLGAEEAVIIFRFDKAQMEAHPYEAMEAFAEGVKIKWLSTVKQFGEDEIVVEQMEMLPDGSGCVGTGQFQTLKTDSLVLAVGQHADVEFLKKVPDIRIGRGNVVEVDARMRASDGIFAGGDMIGGARTMTAAVGHGKKAARNIDAWLRGGVYEKPPEHPAGPVRAAQPDRVPRRRSARARRAAGGEAHGIRRDRVRPLGNAKRDTRRRGASPAAIASSATTATPRAPSRRSSSLERAGSTGSSSTSAPGAPRASNSARVMPSRWRRSREPRGWSSAPEPRECPLASRSGRRASRKEAAACQ